MLVLSLGRKWRRIEGDRRWVLLAVAVASFISVSVRPGPASGAECPNEVLRAENGSLELPDCRAYEKVTPASKGGAEFNQAVYLGDGPRLAFETFATFGGVESAAVLGSAVEIGRSEGGWNVGSISAPASKFEGSNFSMPLRALGTSGSTLLGLRTRGTPVDGESLYLRRGDAITEIGPEAPPSSLIGLPNQEAIATDGNGGYFNFQLATPDLSHVVFELFSRFSPEQNNYLWPFDQTAEGFFSTAYEYVGTGNYQPFLVGVTGGPGSSDLISGCGTSIGSLGSQDIYNAISSDGSVVYFTPGGEDTMGPCTTTAPEPAHTELYARIDGETASAHTVEISEPSKADCSACRTEEPEVELKQAVFQGASEDGSKVFFLTEQELLPGNPGENLYEYDFTGPAGGKVTAVTHLGSAGEAGVQGVVRVSPDGSHVYFVARAAMTAESNSTGAATEAGKDNLYVFDTTTDQLRFVATLAEADSEMWSVSDRGRQAQTTPDGRFLLFTSLAHLTPDDSSTVRQLFRYDSSSGQLIRISVGQNGFNNNGNTHDSPVVMGGPGGIFEHYAGSQNGPSPRLISDDGSYIAFESTAGLTPKALDHVELPNHTGNFARNVYEWHDGEVGLISDGRDRNFIGTQNPFEQVSAVHLIGMTPLGEDIVFTTADPLVPRDIGHGQDIYDARAGGGFMQAGIFSCEGEACQPPASAAPASAAIGSGVTSTESKLAPHGPGHTKHKKHKKKKKHKPGHKKTRHQKVTGKRPQTGSSNRAGDR
jgi:hypothetical protein